MSERGTTPPSRWQLGGEGNGGYAQRFAELVEAGADVDGEARLADALVPRAARILDVGSGMGRVAAALSVRGHLVTAIEPDPALRAQSRRTFPDLQVGESDVLDLAPDAGPFDLVLAVGNVMVFLAPGTEVEALTRMAGVLAPGGRILVGFHLEDAPETARRVSVEEFGGEVEAAGLRVEGRYGSYELHPPSASYAVWLLARA